MHSTDCDTFKSIIKTKLDLKIKTVTVKKSEEKNEKKNLSNNNDLQNQNKVEIIFLDVIHDCFAYLLSKISFKFLKTFW